MLQVASNQLYHEIKKMDLSFTFEFRNFLDLFSAPVGTELALAKCNANV